MGKSSTPTQTTSTSYQTNIPEYAQPYVETMLGRRRYFPNLKSGLNLAMKKREEREAINAPHSGHGC